MDGTELSKNGKAFEKIEDEDQKLIEAICCHISKMNEPNEKLKRSDLTSGSSPSSSSTILQSESIAAEIDAKQDLRNIDCGSKIIMQQEAQTSWKSINLNVADNPECSHFSEKSNRIGEITHSNIVNKVLPTDAEICEIFPCKICNEYLETKDEWETHFRRMHRNDFLIHLLDEWIKDNSLSKSKTDAVNLLTRIEMEQKGPDNDNSDATDPKSRKSNLIRIQESVKREIAEEFDELRSEQAEMLSTESDAHILDEIIDKILTHKANKSNPTVEPMVGKNSNKRMPQKQTELPISAENHVAPNDVTPQYLNDSEHSNDVPVQMPSSNGKPQQYVCKTCGQNYKSITRFTEHLRRHTGEKPYACPECTEMFISTLDLGRHLKVSHRMKKDARTCALAVAKTIYSERVQFKLIPTQVNQVDESTEKQFFPKGIETPKNASNAKSVYGSNELDLSRKQRTEIDEGMLVKKRSVIPPVPSVLGEIFPISYQNSQHNRAHLAAASTMTTAAASSVPLSPTPETVSPQTAHQFHLQLQQKTKDDTNTSDQANQSIASSNNQQLRESKTNMKTTELLWNCSSCGQNFCMQQQSKTSSMKTIMLEWNCSICGRNFCTSTLLNNHIQNDHKNKRSCNKPACQYKCPCCCFKSSDFNVDEFKQHLETVHHLLVYDPHEQLSGNGSSNPLDEPTDQRSSPSCTVDKNNQRRNEKTAHILAHFGMARGIAYHQLKQMKKPTSSTDVSTNGDKKLMEPDGKANSHNVSSKSVDGNKQHRNEKAADKMKRRLNDGDELQSTSTTKSHASATASKKSKIPMSALLHENVGYRKCYQKDQNSQH